VKHGSVYQRHLKSCPRDETGAFAPHRCHGAWGYVIDLPRAADGRRRQVTKSGFPTRAAARAAMQEVAALLASDFSPHAMTVGQYLDDWLAGKHALKPSTQAHYADAIRLYLKPHIGHIELMALRVEHLDRLYAAIRTGVSGKPLSNASRRRIHACLRSALNTAARRRLIAHNPALYVELPPEDPKRSVPWTVAEVRAFLDATEADRLATLFVLLLVTGMRRGEAVGLRWVDVDLEHQRLTVAQQITEVRGRPTLGTPKTRRGARRVPLDPTTVELLRRHRDQQRAERRQWGLPAAADLVFTREDGTALRPDSVTKYFHQLVTGAGLRVIRLHDLRHTNASLALDAGVDVKIMSDRLGHANTAITNDIYTHVSTDVGRAAAARLAGLILGPATAETHAPDAASPDRSPADVSCQVPPPTRQIGPGR
jgi:integrase